MVGLTTSEFSTLTGHVESGRFDDLSSRILVNGDHVGETKSKFRHSTIVGNGGVTSTSAMSSDSAYAGRQSGLTNVNM